jgi:hypothetical protein
MLVDELLYFKQISNIHYVIGDIQMARIMGGLHAVYYQTQQYQEQKE